MGDRPDSKPTDVIFLFFKLLLLLAPLWMLWMLWVLWLWLLPWVVLGLDMALEGQRTSLLLKERQLLRCQNPAGKAVQICCCCFCFGRGFATRRSRRRRRHQARRAREQRSQTR